MKKVLTLFFLCSIIIAKAQTTFPMPGATWSYMVEQMYWNGPTTFNHKVVAHIGDTTIMGKQARILSNMDYFNTCSAGSGKLYIYSSNDSVFFYNSISLGQWQLLYDFGASTGQSWYTYLSDNSQVDTITTFVDSVTNKIINGQTLKVLHVRYYQSGYNTWYSPRYSKIIERIGDQNYLLNYLPYYYGSCDFAPTMGPLLCYSDSTFATYQPDSTKGCDYVNIGIKEYALHELVWNIYPNPAKNTLHIDLKNGSFGSPAELVITDIAGRVIKREEIKTAEGTINIEELKAGVYFAKITLKGNTTVRKFVVE